MCDFLLNKLRKTSNEINFCSHLRESFKIASKTAKHLTPSPTSMSCWSRTSFFPPDYGF